MVWKVKRVCLVLLVLLCGLSAIAQASTHTIYENGNLSTTYVTYFKDILSGSKFSDNYVAFRSGQYSYSMIVGDIEYTGYSFISTNCTEYIFTTSSGYNSQYTYEVIDLNDFSVDVSNQIIYSDLGAYPELIERGAKYEFISAVLISILMLSVVISRIFRKC